jgi:hypothetical protein
VKFIAASDGLKNLTTDRKKRVALTNSVATLFAPESKEATLYIHFGGLFDKGFREGQLTINIFLSR